MAETKKEKLYLDTFVFMDILSGNQEYVSKAQDCLGEIKSGRKEAVVSAILLTELAFHIKRRKGGEKAQEILYYIRSIPNLKIIPVSEDIAEAAGLLRARYMKKLKKKLTYFDAVHLATALAEGCSRFVTGDRGFKDIQEIEVEIY